MASFYLFYRRALWQKTVIAMAKIKAPAHGKLYYLFERPVYGEKPVMAMALKLTVPHGTNIYILLRRRLWEQTVVSHASNPHGVNQLIIFLSALVHG